MSIEICLRAAHRDHGRPGTSNHAGDGRPDTAARGAGHHDDAAVKLQQVIFHWFSSIPSNSASLVFRPERASPLRGDVRFVVGIE
jgi:hypothetical protein